MKKTTFVKKEKKSYEIYKVIDNVAIIKSYDNQYGLLNIKTNEMIWDFSKNFISENHFVGKVYKFDYIGADKLVSIYDTKKDKIILSDYIVWDTIKKEDLMIVESPDGIKHLLNTSEDTPQTKEVYDIPLDRFSHFDKDYDNEFYIISSKGKKSIYLYGTFGEKSRLLVPLEYDKIEKKEKMIILTKGDKKQFLHPIFPFDISEEYDDIIFDECTPYILYLKEGDKVTAYNRKTQEKLFTRKADNAKFLFNEDKTLDTDKGQLVFKISRNNKQGIISVFLSEYRNKGDKPEVYKGLDTAYNYISEKPDILMIRKGKKYGLFKRYCWTNYIVNPKYDSVESIYDQIYILNQDNKSDIYTFDYNGFNPLVENVEVIDKNGRGLVYKKNDKCGLIGYYGGDRPVVVDAKYDNIQSVSIESYIVEENNKKGLIQSGEIIIDVNYDDININVKGLYDYNHIYATLKQGNNYKYAVSRGYASADGMFNYHNDNDYNSIDFYEFIVVAKDDNYTYIYDYYDKLIQTLEGNINVTEEKHGEDKDSVTLYNINGEQYYYIKGKLNKTLSDDSNLYVTTYETEDKIYEVSSFNKERHDSFCEKVDEMDDSEAEQYLIVSARNAFSKTNKPIVRINIKNKEK